VVNARSLDYNLFKGRFELKEVTVSGAGAAGMPVPVTAQRVELVVPFSRLIRGSLDTARVQIAGLSVHFFTGRDGRTNLPSLKSSGSSGNPKGPTVQVSGATFDLQDERNGLALRLPIQKLSAEWHNADSRYQILCEAGGGALQLKDTRVPLDRIAL